eukprot:symbB.v1.2.018706.t1/scaffold1502.1/size115091/3
MIHFGLANQSLPRGGRNAEQIRDAGVSWNMMAYVSNILVVLVFCCLGLLFLWLLLCGLPKKPLQDESVKNGCPRRIVTAGLSDRLGRRRTVLVCMALLSVWAAFRITRVEWIFGKMVEDGTKWNRNINCFRLVAPVFGGLLAEIFGWRMSFFVLAVLWGIFAIYAYVNMVESCPDGSTSKTFLGDLKRLLDPYLLCLLLTESCMMGAYVTFNANVSYLIQVSYDKPTMTTSMVMLAFGALNGIGLWVMKKFHLGSISRTAKIAVTCYAVTGIISFVLGSIFPQFLWSYLIGTFLQASTITTALVSVNVMFFEPLHDIAGIAASYEICAKSVLPCFFSLFSTQSLISFGAKGLTQFQASACIASGVVFWYSTLLSTDASIKDEKGSIRDEKSQSYQSCSAAEDNSKDEKLACNKMKEQY